MNAIVEQALTLWGFEDATWSLIADRENAVYRVDAGHGSFALRLHRQGYRTDAELCSELMWMAALGKGGLSVPVPCLSCEGQQLHVIDRIQVDVLTWLAGDTMDYALNICDRTALFRHLGAHMARFHAVSDAWHPPAAFVRCHWSREGLLGEKPLWDRFWENPALTSVDRGLFTTLRSTADQHLRTIEGGADYGLIHADLVPANVLVDGDSLYLIDFDDGGYGFRLFEIATVLLKHHQAPDYIQLKAALIEGYTDLRPLDTSALDLFLALRAATYVGWNITRMDEDETGDRNARFISSARDLAARYLA